MAMRDKEGRALPNAHLLGFLWRILKLLFYGIKPVFVFDGGAPVQKRRTLANRRHRRAAERDTLARTAEKLLAAQLRQAALRHAAAARPAASSSRDALETPMDGAVYYDSVGRDHAPLTSARQTHEAAAAEATAAARTALRSATKDPYQLPDMPKLDGAPRKDLRFATEAELRSLMSTIAPEDLDIHSELFRSLPTELQYELVGDLRLQSRGTSYKRLQDMLAAAPTPIDFSRAQVAGLKTRNDLTQKVLTVTDELGSANIQVPLRVASLRNREYVLTHIEGGDGGWALGRPDAGSSADKAIVLEDDRKPVAAQDDDIDDMDLEDVEIPHAASKPDPELDPLVHTERDPVLRKARALAFLSARAEQHRRLQRKEAGLDARDERYFGHAVDVHEHDPLFRERVLPTDDDDDKHQPELTAVPRTSTVPGGDGVPFSAMASLDAATSESGAWERKDDRPALAARKAPRTSPATAAVDLTAADDRTVRTGTAAEPWLSREKLERDTELPPPGSPGRDAELAPRLTTQSGAALSPPAAHAPDAQALPRAARGSGVELSLLAGVSPPARAASSPDVKETVPLSPADMAMSDERKPAPEPAIAVARTRKALAVPPVDLVPKASSSPGLERANTQRSSYAMPHGAIPTTTPTGVSTGPPPDVSRSPEEKAAFHPTSPPPKGGPAPVPSTTPSLEKPSLPAPAAAQPAASHDLGLSVSGPAVEAPSSSAIEAAPSRAVEASPSRAVEAAPSRAVEASPSRAVEASLSPAVEASPSRAVEASPSRAVEASLSSAAEAPPSATAVWDPSMREDQAASPAREPSAAPSTPSSPYAWSASPSPEPVVLGPDGFPLSNGIEEGEEADEPPAAQLEQDQAEFATFLSETTGRSLYDLQREVAAEVDTLREERARLRRAEEDTSTAQMTAEIQALLRVFGLPYLTAPMEAEAQCATLARQSLVDGIITDDSDVFLFGGSPVYRNMFNNQRMVECYRLPDLERELGLGRERLIQLAFLLGSDYTEGLSGVGPVLAMEILSLFPGERALERFCAWWRDVQVGQDTDAADAQRSVRRRIKRALRNKVHLSAEWPDPTEREAYDHPSVDASDEPFVWGRADLDAVRAFLHEYLHWPTSKTDEYVLPVIEQQRKTARLQKTQATLEHMGFVGGDVPARPRSMPYGSSRLQQVVQSFRQAQALDGAAPAAPPAPAVPPAAAPRRARKRRAPSPSDGSSSDEAAPPARTTPRSRRLGAARQAGRTSSLRPP